MTRWETAGLVGVLMFGGSFVALLAVRFFGAVAKRFGHDRDENRGSWTYVCDNAGAGVVPTFTGSLQDACDWLTQSKFFKITGWDAASRSIRFAVEWTQYREVVPCAWHVIRLDPQDAGDWALPILSRSQAITAALQSGSHVLIGVRDEDRVITVRKNTGKPS
jgi:hypothetical protein